MEVDDDEIEYEVDCQVIGHCFGAVFITFQSEKGEGQYAMVRSHRLFLNGRRVRPSEIKTVDKLANVLKEHFTHDQVRVFAKVRNINRDGASYKTEDGREVRPTWYSHCVWIGDEPGAEEQKAKGPKSVPNGQTKGSPSSPTNVPTIRRRPSQVNAVPPERVFVESDYPALAEAVVRPNEQPSRPGEVVSACKGRLLYQNQAGLGFLEFDHQGHTTTAIFNSKVILLDGKPMDPSHMKLWQDTVQAQTVTIYFNAHQDDQLYPHKRVERSDGRLETLIYKPTWRCTAVWVGQSPSEETLDKLAAALLEMSSTKKKKRLTNEEKEKIRSCDYFGGRLTTIVDRQTGVLQQRDKAVLFKIQDLWINGQPTSGEDKLSSIVSLGEILFCYVRPLMPPKRIGDILCDRVAVQIWRGKRSKSRSQNNSECSHGNDHPLVGLAHMDDLESQEALNDGQSEDESSLVDPRGATDKATFDMPSLASECNYQGVVKEIDSGLGVVALVSEDPIMNGQMALFSRYRTYIDGQRLKYWDFLKEHVQSGDVLGVDLVRADPSKAAGAYQWLALLAWKGPKPDPDTVKTEIEKRCDFYRARVIQLDKCPVRGSVSGVLHVIRGPNSVGERAIFKREHTYVFGARMAKADLCYVIKEKDKIQLEMERLDDEDVVEAKRKYGCEIKYCATLAWVGPTPKLERDCDTFPFYIGNSIYPFLHKRGMDEEFFSRLITGDLPPKKDPLSESAIDVSISLNPNEIWGRLVELKKPDAPKTGTEHGIIMIENGPFSNERAFFNRNSLWCWGHNMTKADLMHVIKESDRFNIEVRHGTNNKSVPFQVSHAWVGPHPEDKQRLVSESDPDFEKWLASHDLDMSSFQKCVDGKLEVKPYFPLPLEQQCARIVHFYPSKRLLKGQGTEAGILKVHQGSLMKKDVLFERDSVYIWGVHFRKGDLRYVFREGDKVFCEATEISGREKKKWQAKLGIQSIPKYMATIVFVGGGRPKCNNPALCELDELQGNTNLAQWLKKRSVELALFKDLLDGTLWPHKDNQMMSGAGAHGLEPEDPCQSCGTWSQGKSSSASHYGGMFGDCNGYGDVARPPRVVQDKSAMDNPLMSQAEDLIHRVLHCSSTNDESVKNLIQSSSEVCIAEFIFKTLGTAVQAYHQRALEAQPNNGQPPPPTNAAPYHHQQLSRGSGNSFEKGPRHMSLGPIGPPPRQPQLPSTNLPLNGGGLYGLQQPLLDFAHPNDNEIVPRNRLARQESPSDHVFTSPPEPPYKRKTHFWQ